MAIEKNTMNRLKHEQSPFTTLVNETVNAITDPAALGIYCFLAGKPENWEISTKHLMNHFNKGRDFINQRLKYLREIGALVVVDIRDEKGRFISRESLLKRTLQPTTRKTPTVDNPQCGETLPTKERTKQKKELNKDIDKRARAAEKNKNKNSSSKFKNKTVESPPPKQKEESEMPIDPSFHYPETYYSTHQTENSLIKQSVSGGLTQDLTSAPEGFKKFWEIWPRKQNILKALTQWVHDGCEQYADKIIEKVKLQKRKDKAFLDGCIPSAWKYIVEKRYLDEIFEGKTKGTFDHDDTSWADSDRQGLFD